MAQLLETTGSLPLAPKSLTHRNLKTLLRLSTSVLEEIEHFFISYNDFKGKKFKPLGRFGPQRANKLIKDGVKRLALARNCEESIRRLEMS